MCELEFQLLLIEKIWVGCSLKVAKATEQREYNKENVLWGLECGVIDVERVTGIF